MPGSSVLWLAKLASSIWTCNMLFLKTFCLKHKTSFVKRIFFGYSRCMPLVKCSRLKLMFWLKKWSSCATQPCSLHGDIKWPHLCKVKKSLEHLVSITLISLWMPYSSNLALLPTSWKCRVCNTKVQCIFSTSFNAWSSKLGPYLTYSLVHEMIYLLLEAQKQQCSNI